MIIPTIVPIHPDEHIIGWIERLAEVNNIAPDILLSHYFDISDEVYSKQDGSMKWLGGLSRLADAADIGNGLRDIIMAHTSAAADAVFMNPFSSAVYLGGLCSISSMIRKNKVMDTFLPSRRKYCPLCAQEDTKDYGQVLMHSPHQSTVVNTCWKHGIRLVNDALDGACVCSSEEDIKTARFMHGVYMREIIADIRTVQSVVLSDKYMRKIKTLMDSGQMDEIFQYADIRSLTEFYKYLFSSSTQNGANQIKIARAIAQFADIEDIEKAAPEPARTRTECDLILQAENKGSTIVSYDFPLITIRCGRCGNVYTTWYQSVTSGLLCPHCIHFTLQRDVSEEMFKVFARRHGFKLSGERDKKRVEIIHTCGKKQWIDPVTALSHGSIACPCGISEKDGFGNSKQIMLALQRIGAREQMKCGMEAEIIAYRRAKDIDIRFEDGTVRQTSYSNFLARNVLPVDKAQYIRNGRTGEKVQMRCGQMATVIACHNGQRVNILFEDGHVRENVLYSAFKKGIIAPIKTDKSKIRIGQSRRMRNGTTAKIIAYRNHLDIDVEFDDGDIREHVSCWDFDTGNCSSVDNHIGKKKMMKCGLDATITAYREANDMDVRFSDGSELHHVTTRKFNRGTLYPPGDDWISSLGRKKSDELVGMRRTMGCGQEATIIEYRHSTDIDIKFEDGSVRSGVSLAQFKKSNIAPVNHYRYADLRIGEKAVMKCGQEAEIIAYRNARDMDIRFSDGTVKASCDYSRFKRGELSPVRQDRTIYGRIGEKAMMKCGLEAEIVEYRRSDDMDVRFSDGSSLTGVQYHNFGNRTLRPTIARSVERIGEKRIMRCGLEAEIIAYRNANDMDVRFSNGTQRTGVAYHNFKNGRVSAVPRGIKK